MSKIEKRTRRGLKAKAIQKKQNVARLVVYRSANHIYSQIIVQSESNDKNIGDITLASASTLSDLHDKKGDKTEKAIQIGKIIAEKAKAKGINKVAFDRSGYKYHGRVKALAEGARNAGLIF
jgi:large subunit ribosomal protein L18